jgi:hypothetical protein
MFNSYTNRNTYIDFPDTIKIKEKRAPTDDSMRLIEEMKDKIKKEFITSFNSSDNDFSISCDVYSQFGVLEIFVLYSLNGKEYSFKIIEREMDIGIRYKNCPEKWFQDKVVKEITQHVSNTISELITKNVVYNCALNMAVSRIFE